MIIGVDQGYYATKTSEGIVFPSRITTQENIIGENCSMVYEGKKYFVGEGEVEVDLNKINKELTKICIIYSLAKSSETFEFDIVTGLPIGLFTKQKDELKNMLLSSKANLIEIGKKKRSIIINNVEVFPQGAGSLYSTNIDGDVILIDIGGRTIDICLFEVVNGRRKVTKHSTKFEATLPLYSKIVHLVNNKLEISLRLDDGEKILRDGIEIYGQKQDLSFLKSTIEEHIEPLFQELTLNYPIKTTKIALAGGGAYLYKNIFSKRIPNTSIIPNPQLANAIGFKRIGESLWQQRY